MLVQALAAVGQCQLMSLWASLFAHLQQPVAQILLTRNDIADACPPTWSRLLLRILTLV